MSDEQMREAFEAWFAGGDQRKGVARDEHGNYRLMSAHSSWMAWRSAWADARRLTVEECAAVCKALREGTLALQSGAEHESSNVTLRMIAELGHGKCEDAIRALLEDRAAASMAGDV